MKRLKDGFASIFEVIDLVDVLYYITLVAAVVGMLLLANCATSGIRSRHIISTGLRVCSRTPVIVKCSYNLNARECELVQESIAWWNHAYKNVRFFQYGGVVPENPGQRVTAFNVVVVGYAPVVDRVDLLGLKPQRFMETRVWPDIATGCAVYTNVQVLLHMSELSDDRVLAAYIHELGHVLGLNHSGIRNTLMYPASPAEPPAALSPEEWDTIDAIYSGSW